jgi:hypothetical protein
MGAPQYEQAGADVAGTGTANYVAKWTGGSTLGNSIIAQDAGSTGIAIGDAAGVSYVGLVQIKKAGGAGWLTLDHTGGSYAEVQSYNVPLYLNRQGNNTILNSTSGNVGIGTASPIGNLDVRATNPTIVCSNSATRYGYSVWNDAASEFRTGTGGAHAFVLLTSNTERMRIDSSGNVILNTATTGATIQAAGSQQGIKLQASATGTNNTNPNTLDYYEEGTWTTTFSGSVNVTGTPTLSNARYTRIGRVVTIEGTVTWTVTAGSTSTYTSMTLPSGINRATTDFSGCGSAMVGTSPAFTVGGLYNAAGTNNTVVLIFGSSTPLAAGAHAVYFTYTYFSA